MIEVWKIASVKGDEPRLVRVVEPPEISGTKYEVTGLMASTKYTFRVIGITADGVATNVVSKTISTVKYPAVTKIKLTRIGESLVLTWKIPSKPANGAVYERYEIDWVISTMRRATVAIETSSNTSATVLLSTLEALGIRLTSTKKHNFVIRAVIDDGTTVVNQSLEAKFSIVPAKL